MLSGLMWGFVLVRVVVVVLVINSTRSDSMRGTGGKVPRERSIGDP